MLLGKYNHYNPTTGRIDPNEAEKPVYISVDTMPVDYTDISSIENWHLYGKKAKQGEASKIKCDHGYVVEQFMQIAKTTTWILLSNSDKDLVAYYYAIDPVLPTYGDTEIITHYVITKGMTVQEASAYHIQLVSENLNRLVKMAKLRADCHRLKAAFIMYFKDITTVNNFVNATAAYTVSYKGQYLLGVGRGDTKTGYLDFVENTGFYSAGGGIKDYEMNTDLVLAYLPLVDPVDINNPTQAELDAAEGLVRNVLVDKIVDKLVYGKAI